MLGFKDPTKLLKLIPAPLLELKDMTDKYFTPSIEDIRVGYECEVNMGLVPGFREGWNRETLNQENTAYYLKFGSAKSMFRVPYITKEQIEAEGWEITSREHKPKPYEVDWVNAKKGDFRLWINLALHKSMHLGIDKTNGAAGILFRGQCKDINTFRYICKLLGI